jgi:hypothetical protein
MLQQKTVMEVIEDKEQYDYLSPLFNVSGSLNAKDRLFIWHLARVYEAGKYDVAIEFNDTIALKFHLELITYLETNDVVKNKEFKNEWATGPLDPDRTSQEIINYFGDLINYMINSITISKADNKFLEKVTSFTSNFKNGVFDNANIKLKNHFTRSICFYLIWLTNCLFSGVAAFKATTTGANRKRGIELRTDASGKYNNAGARFLEIEIGLNTVDKGKSDADVLLLTSNPVTTIITQINYDFTNAAVIQKLPYFSYKLTKLYEMLQLKKTQESSNLSQLYPKSKFLEDELPTKDIYFRKASEPKSLYMFDEKTKKEIRVDKLSSTYDKFLSSGADQCVGLRENVDVSGSVVVGTTTSPSQKLSCYKFLMECLTSNDKNSIKQCKIFMTQKEFWDNIKTEIYTNMLPAIAIDLLEKFGFVRVSVEDSVAKRKLIKFETVESWLSNLIKKIDSKELTKEEFEAIQKNDKLIAYLQEVVKKINTSPAILNEDYVGPSEGTLAYNPNKFSHTYFGKILKPRVVDTSSNNYVRRLSGVLNTNLQTMKLRLNPIIVGRSGSTYIQAGGDSVLTKRASVELKNLYKSLSEQLNSQNKQIAPEDKKDIELTLDNFERTENKLHKIVNLIDKYIEMTIVFRHNDPENILTADHLQEFLAAKDKIIEKIDKKQTNLVSILSTLSESVNATEKKVDSILKKNPESVVPGSVPPSKYTYNN